MQSDDAKSCVQSCKPIGAAIYLFYDQCLPANHTGHIFRQNMLAFANYMQARSFVLETAHDILLLCCVVLDLLIDTFGVDGKTQVLDNDRSGAWHIKEFVVSLPRLQCIIS